MKITTHLKKRHLDPKDYQSIYISEETGKAYFFLYSLSGQIVGFQCYTPSAPKRDHKLLDQERRYYTYLTKEKTGHVKLTAFGLERLTDKKKPIFLVEGIFDACRLHKLGLQSLALLGSSIGYLKPFLTALGYELIPVCEGDEAGQKLATLSTHGKTIYLSQDMDLGDMEETDIKETFKSYL